jgi:hypothetical protein
MVNRRFALSLRRVTSAGALWASEEQLGALWASEEQSMNDEARVRVVGDWGGD